LTADERNVFILQAIGGDKLPSMVKKQIVKFNQMGITNKQIARAVNYHFIVRRNKTDSVDKFGIGIVPSVCEASDAYFDAAARRAKRSAESAANAKECINIMFRPKRSKKKKGLDINDI